MEHDADLCYGVQAASAARKNNELKQRVADLERDLGAVLAMHCSETLTKQHCKDLWQKHGFRSLES